MRELLRTNDPVLLSLAETVLGEAGIGCFVADRNISNAEGSLGIFPRRLLVAMTSGIRHGMSCSQRVLRQRI